MKITNNIMIITNNYYSSEHGEHEQFSTYKNLAISFLLPLFFSFNATILNEEAAALPDVR